MPSKSESQRKLMAAAAHDPEFAKKVGIKQETAKEWNQADKKAGKRKLPDHVEHKKKEDKKKPSNETYVTTATLNGGRGFRDH